ncbi:MAG: LuxR C-terminal-related transcriptional regulator [Acidimicrobiales bacterium]
MNADVLAGRDAFEQRRWPEAVDLLWAADRESPLELDDLERLATAAYLAGADEESERISTRAHHEAIQRGDLPRAARHAFWLGFGLAMRGELAQAGGWFGRAQRVLDECGEDCVERGYVLVPLGLQALDAGRHDEARATFERVAGEGARYGDVDLTTLGRLGIGQARIAGGDAAAGIRLLDEAMVAVTADEVSPVVAGIVYCAVIEACNRNFDPRRAEEWTEALSRWCAEQPGLVPYRGQCLVHRSEVHLLHGRWAEAMDEAEQAQDQLSRPRPHPALGSAWYQRAELHRLRGDLAAAERGYREASRWGNDPQPGLALLRLAEGSDEAAAAAIRRAVDEAGGPPERARLLPAFVDILLAVDDVDTAALAVEELRSLAEDLDAPLLRARAAYALGAVLLARGDPAGALEAIRRADAAWQQLHAPFESARTRVLTAAACRELGDRDTAALEIDAARRTFEELGARPALAEIAASPAPGTAAHPLTAREVEVLRLVSAGRTNKDIAADLVVSDRTVDRHISNIFSKLGLSSRAAATAWAYEHGVV